MDEIWKSAITVVTGGAIWEGVKFISPEIKRFFESRKNAKEAFYKNLDPILKVASELYGKLESLAKEDFSTFKNPNHSNSSDPVHNKKYICFLFAQFWAQLEFLRLESQYISLSKIRKGNELLKFISTIESRSHRILDRSIQRIIGECLLYQKEQKFRVMTLNEFIIQIDDQSSNLHRWIAVLESKLTAAITKEQRQPIMRFGIIVVALIDHFDSSHKIARERNIYVNKLSEKNKRIIKNNWRMSFVSKRAKV